MSYCSTWCFHRKVCTTFLIFPRINYLYSVDIIKNLDLVYSGVEDRRAFAHKIAQDLFQYMVSFSQASLVGEMLLVPTNILDRWLERFNRKYSLDPNFMLKT